VTQTLRGAVIELPFVLPAPISHQIELREARMGDGMGAWDHRPPIAFLLAPITSCPSPPLFPPPEPSSLPHKIITMSSSSQYARDLYAEAEEATAMDHLNDDMDDVEDDDDGLGPDVRMDPYEDLEDEDLEDLNDIRIIMGEDRITRKVKWQHRRVDWDYHREMLLYTGQFENRFRMEENHFDRLLEVLQTPLTVSFKHSLSSTSGNEPITPEIILACGLRFLGLGENPPGLADTYGMSISSAKRVIRMFLNAVDYNETCPDLQIVLPDPNDREELDKLADEWEGVSTGGNILSGHLGALDGWLPRTEAPRDVDNQGDYWSGHYQCYGLNCQALCDPDLLFMFFCVSAPGKCNDNRAFGRCRGLKEWLAALPDEYFVGGDNAYTVTRKLLTPFTRAQLENDKRFKRVYNYFLSQLRIRIEMAFGRLTTKWRRLRTTLNFTNATNSQIIRVCIKLHNFCIRNKLKDGTYVRPQLSTSSNDPDELNAVDPSDFDIDPIDMGYTRKSKWGYLPSEPDRDTAPVPYSQSVQPDTSKQMAVLAEIRSRHMRRPRGNIDRNGN